MIHRRTNAIDVIRSWYGMSLEIVVVMNRSLKKFVRNVLRNIKYIIRDTLFYNELLAIREYLDEIIKEKVENGYTEQKQEV